VAQRLLSRGHKVRALTRKPQGESFENKARIEETVRGLGFPSYTILRPSRSTPAALLAAVLPGN